MKADEELRRLLSSAQYRVLPKVKGSPRPSGSRFSFAPAANCLSSSWGEIQERDRLPEPL
jgi:hypothetical protein